MTIPGHDRSLSANTINRHEQDGSARQSEEPMLAPGSLALMTLIAGPLVGGLACSAILIRLKLRNISLFLALGSILLSPAVYIGLILWPIDWYWPSLVLLGLHFLCATLVYIWMRQLYQSYEHDYCVRFSSTRKALKTYLMSGIFSGICLSLILGLAGLVVYLLISDHLFANLMPVAFNDQQALYLLVIAQLSLVLSGAIAGGHLGKIALRITGGQLAAFSFAMIWIAITWFFSLQLTTTLPGFQAGQANGAGWYSVFLLFLCANLLVGSWWVSFLLLYCLRPKTWLGKGWRLLQIPLINFCGAVVMAIVFGYSTSWFYSAGKYFEQRGNVSSALWCYEHGLNKDPNHAVAGYLQYRVALLAHKLGRDQQAVSGFRKVVSKYIEDDSLVSRSSRFLDNLENAGQNRYRVVLPGVESPTTFKDAYCVPNSLAVVMNFWGADLDARDIGESITGLGRGTIIVDQAWYANSHGFRHDFLPMASVGDIKAAIDAGFPVLVYVPRHVFAIVGYDEVLKTFVTFDVATRDVWVDYFQEDFIKAWKKSNSTMVLVYPPTEENRIPDSLKTRVEKLSDAFLHYHLHYLDSPDGFVSKEHLDLALAGNRSFFLPQLILYKQFPQLRMAYGGVASDNNAVEKMYSFFSNGFDEGTHLSGQQHYSDVVNADETLQTSLKYLVDQGRLKEVSDLIDQIEVNGLISDKTRGIRAMVDLSLGNLDRGIERLVDSDDDLAFYLALAQRTTGSTGPAVKNLVKTVDGCT